jgi:hypothetical protein
MGPSTVEQQPVPYELEMPEAVTRRTPAKPPSKVHRLLLPSTLSAVGKQKPAPVPTPLALLQPLPLPAMTDVLEPSGHARRSRPLVFSANTAAPLTPSTPSP